MLDPAPTRISLHLDPAQLRAIENRRRHFDDVPSRAEAIRRLLDHALATPPAAAQKRSRKPRRPK